MFQPTEPLKSPVWGEVPAGIWTGSLVGSDKTILTRYGNKLARYAGWMRENEDLRSGLTNETNPRFPDRFVQLGNKVIWTNGIDRALVTTHDGMTTYLGFDTIPASPFVQGPEQPTNGSGTTTDSEFSSFFPNAFGFSWPGRIGTVGDASEGQQGSILASEHYYFLMMEDIHGNLSAPSPPSNPARIATIKAFPYNAGDGDDAENMPAFELDQLTKQFRVRGGGDATDEHCTGWRLYRTPDARNVGNTPQLVARFPSRRKVQFNDALSDSELGPVMPDLVPVPLFKCMCVHQGCLVIANMSGDPGLVRKSVAGLPGTFSRTEYLYVDSGGSEITGLASHGGRLLVFTEHAVFDCSDFQRPTSIADGIGCVAPSSIAAHPSGRLIWLARDGFYALTSGGTLEKLSIGIDEVIYHEVNRSRMNLAVADIHNEGEEYICFLAPAGSARHTLGLVFDGQGWRRLDLGIHVTGMCRDKGNEQYLLLCGRDYGEEHSGIFVYEHETMAYAGENKATALYKSANLYGDELGLHPVHIHSLWVGMVDRSDAEATIRIYRNGEPTPYTTQAFRLMGPDGINADDTSAIYRDVLSRANVGTMQAHEHRLTWRKVDVNMPRCTTWRFEIEVNFPAEIEIAAFAFSLSIESRGNPLGMLPAKQDA